MTENRNDDFPRLGSSALLGDSSMAEDQREAIWHRELYRFHRRLIDDYEIYGMKKWLAEYSTRCAEERGAACADAIDAVDRMLSWTLAKSGLLDAVKNQVMKDMPQI